MPDPNEEAEILAARVRVNALAEIRITANMFEGSQYVHIREYRLSPDGSFLPTPKGVTVRSTQVDALQEALEELAMIKSEAESPVAIDLSGNRQVRLSLQSWQGSVKADIRMYQRRGNAKEYSPTPKGIRFSQALVPELVKGVSILRKHVG